MASFDIYEDKYILYFFLLPSLEVCLPLSEIALSESSTFKVISCVYLANTENKQLARDSTPHMVSFDFDLCA